MVSGILGILVCIHFILISNAQPEFLDWSCADVEDIKYPATANSTYLDNLNTLLSNLSSNTHIDYGFYNFSYGQDSDRVNAIGLCRGDVKLDACLSCLNDSKVLLTQLCPNQKLGIGWYDNCMLRYSNNSIFKTKETYPRGYTTRDSGNTTDVDQFNPVLKELLNSLANQASLGDSRLKFSAGNASGPGLRTIFGLVQCTPDLSKQDCSACLVETIADISECCNSLNGATYLKPSCNIRYEIYPFYDLNNLPIPPSQQPEGKSNTSRTIIAIVVPIMVFVILVNVICIYLMRRSRKHIEAETLQMDFATIMAATNNFSEANKLGKGGFGPVYQGRLSNGQEVAVKRLSMNSLQGDTEFKNEVLLVAKLQHRNLVKLLGFCLKRRERLLVSNQACPIGLGKAIQDYKRHRQRPSLPSRGFTFEDYSP